MYKFSDDREILNFQKLDLDNIVTPIHAGIFANLLRETDYDSMEIDFIYSGFKEGFSLGYQADRKVQIQSKNLKLRVGDEIDLWNKVMKEVKLGRYAGPFDDIPNEFADDYIQSPIGLVAKDHGSDTRLIFHLSYPWDTIRSTSVNANTPRHLCSVEYSDFSEAVCLVDSVIQLGGQCFIGKSDAKSAFRNLGMLRRHWRYLILKARSPIDKKWYFFIDKCLPFGASISCAHFQRVSNAIAHIVQVKTGRQLINYLDDYLFTAFLRALCNQQINQFLKICELIHMPVSVEKTFWSSEVLVFLGLLIDCINKRIAIPMDKITKGRNMILLVISLEKKKKSRRKITVLQLQRICGFLNFLGRAIVPGRAFTRHLYTKISGKLKPHHHIRIDNEMLLDLKLWDSFLQQPSAYLRPFMDFSVILQVEDIGFYMDASKNFSLGFGGICKEHFWMQVRWPEYFKQLDPSIQYLELYAQTAGILAWGFLFANKRVRIHCDNMSVVSMINNSSSSCPNCMILIRILTCHCMVHSLRVFAQHVKTKNNGISDSLSHFQMTRFERLTKHMQLQSEPTPVPDLIWPPMKIWNS